MLKWGGCILRIASKYRYQVSLALYRTSVMFQAAFGRLYGKIDPIPRIGIETDA